MALALIVLGFAAGAIPFGFYLARRRGVNIREHGSGNIGATNVTRVLGPKAGAIVLVLDALKGAVPALLAEHWSGEPWTVVLVGFAAIVGHCFSPFLGGKGGKGVATAMGVFLALAPAFVGIAVGVFVVVLRLTRVPALGSLAGITTLCVLALVRGDAPLAALACATLVLLVYTHRSNLAKL